MPERIRFRVPSPGTPFDDEVYHGGDRLFRTDRFDPERGAYFTSDAGYAAERGRYVHRCRVTLSRPMVYDEAAAESGRMEIDRRLLMDWGYDGRIIVYDDGELDVVAFRAEQIAILETSPAARQEK